MSPARFSSDTPAAIQASLDRLAADLGSRIREARQGRRWTTQRLADEAGVSRSLIYLVERGELTSLETAVRLAQALRLRVEVDLVDPRRRAPVIARAEDPVHAAMGELEAAHMRRLGFTVAIDEPYQHYQFAGRADLLAWDLDRRALLHIENRSCFPNLGEAAGAYNAKKAYLGPAIAHRLGVAPGWASATHAMVALWSAEVLHSIRLRTETFRSLCPDPPEAFTAWWRGTPPSRGLTSALILLDPSASGRQRPFIDLDAALSAKPRLTGYRDAAERVGRV